MPLPVRIGEATRLQHLAQAGGTISSSEVKLLERVCKALQLNSHLLYSDLHGPASGADIASGKPTTSSPQSVVDAVGVRPQVRFDVGRLKDLDDRAICHCTTSVVGIKQLRLEQALPLTDHYLPLLTTARILL
ncbi:hypothetical protein D3C85_966830 [compost metagenome]